MGRVFVLGIDGGSWKVLNRLNLPNFDRLVGGGVSGELKSTYPPVTFPAWKSFSTGKNPGKLGVYGFSDFDRERKENVPNDSTSFDGAELWDYASDEGLYVAVVNMPTTYPPHDVNGVMVAGPNSGESGFVYPEERGDEVKETYVNLSSGHRLAFKSGGDKAVEAAREVIGSRFETTRRLLEKGEFDLFNLTLYCTDTIQHYYWGEQELESVYRYIDEYLGVLMDEHLDEWNVVVVSDHGFRPIKGACYLDTWLERSGFLERETPNTDSVKTKLGLTTENAYSVVKSLGFEKLIGKIPETVVKRMAGRLASGKSVSVVDSVRWKATKAVFLHGGIYVLDDDQKVVDEIESRLKSFTDQDGDMVVDEVHRREDVYEGGYVDRAPNLIPVSNDYKLLGFSRDDALFNPDEHWVAGHEMEGVFIAAGEDFENQDGVELSIYDVMPTLLHVMGCGVPGDVDGVVREDILSMDNEVVSREPVERKGAGEVSGVDRDRINKRLQQLGYLE